ncbi:hypothetical protein K438DRAFT_1756083 [Mycena galopus ATCC 62051]|nr:hypothetical protein K438DRAFT_1756083 [Mycena galopus ATCC 62051]
MPSFWLMRRLLFFTIISPRRPLSGSLRSAWILIFPVLTDGKWMAPSFSGRTRDKNSNGDFLASIPLEAPLAPSVNSGGYGNPAPLLPPGASVSRLNYTDSMMFPDRLLGMPRRLLGCRNQHSRLAKRPHHGMTAQGSRIEMILSVVYQKAIDSSHDWAIVPVRALTRLLTLSRILSTSGLSTDAVTPRVRLYFIGTFIYYSVTVCLIINCVSGSVQGDALDHCGTSIRDAESRKRLLRLFEAIQSYYHDRSKRQRGEHSVWT